MTNFVSNSLTKSPRLCCGIPIPGTDENDIGVPLVLNIGQRDTLSSNSPFCGLSKPEITC
ncbi:hypothetical protein QTP88_024319 [Uroleucon formosanum]